MSYGGEAGPLRQGPRALMQVQNLRDGNEFSARDGQKSSGDGWSAMKEEKSRGRGGESRLGPDCAAPSGHDWLHGLWGLMQNGNAGPLYGKFLRISR